MPGGKADLKLFTPEPHVLIDRAEDDLYMRFTVTRCGDCIALEYSSANEREQEHSGQLFELTLEHVRLIAHVLGIGVDCFPVINDDDGQVQRIFATEELADRYVDERCPNNEFLADPDTGENNCPVYVASESEIHYE